MGMEFEDQYLQAKKPEYDCLLFDLDDTLYPLASGLALNCNKNIRDYMTEKLGIDESKVAEMASFLYRSYGTTMAGLRAIGYSFNYDDFHRQLLLSIPVRKVIFTNADKIHATKVLSRLGLEDCFDGIICFETLNRPDESSPSHETASIKPNIFNVSDELPETPILCKPSEAAIARALEIAKVNAKRAIFFDDSIRNIQAGKRIGLKTVLVGASHRVNGADYALESIHNIKEALPELWQEGEEARNAVFGGEVAIEMPVYA